MSEVQDACQIVLVAGKGAYWVGKIQMKLAMSILKLLNTIYLAKWKGEASLNRFRNIKGDNYLFVNVNTEDDHTLKEIEKELKNHGILFARMPDLCGGDGRTQYVISPSDAAKFKSFLIDHNEGKNCEIKVGTIDVEDYMQSGYDEHGKETPEMKKLNRSAAEEMKKMHRTEPVKQQEPEPNKRQTGDRSEEVKQQKPEPYRRQASDRTAPGESDRHAENRRRNQDSKSSLSSKTIQYHCIRHDEMVAESGYMEWIYDKPMEKQDDWCMFEMRDGRHAVIVPQSEHYTLISGSGPKYRTAIYGGREYTVVDMENGEIQTMKGAAISAQMQKPDIRTINFRNKNRYQNTRNGREWEPKTEDFQSRTANRQRDNRQLRGTAAGTSRPASDRPVTHRER